MKLFKKIAIALLAVCVVGGSVVGMTACGEEPTPTTPSASSAYTNNYSNTGVQDYLNRSDVQSQINTLKSGLKDSGSTLDVVAEGNSMVYIYKFNTMQSLTQSDLDTISSQLKSQQEVFRSLINEIESLTSAVNPSVVTRYVNADGSIIIELTSTKTSMVDTTPAGSYTPTTSTGSYGTATQKFASLQAYLDANASTLNSSLDSLVDTFYKETGVRLNMDIYAQGNTLVYEMRMVSYQDDSFGTYMQNFLNDSDTKSAYSSIADQVEQYVDANINVKILVKDVNGNVIAQGNYY